MPPEPDAVTNGRDHAHAPAPAALAPSPFQQRVGSRPDGGSPHVSGVQPCAYTRVRGRSAAVASKALGAPSASGAPGGPAFDARVSVEEQAGIPTAATAAASATSEARDTASEAKGEGIVED